MGENKSNTGEELLFSLPDYINGKITDSSLKSEIESLIETDEEFRNEYIAMKNTFQFVAGSSLESPPEHYFTGLVPRINTRLENSASSKLSIHGILHLWRYVVPALTVILVIIIVSMPGKKQFEVSLSDSQNVTGTTSLTNDTLKVPVTESTVENVVSNTENNNTTTGSTSVRTKKVSENEPDNILEGLSEFIDGEVEQPVDADYYFDENEFGNLSPAEQNELIANLSKTKF